VHKLLGHSLHINKLKKKI